jgi:release factor glutamine methyltransferase
VNIADALETCAANLDGSDVPNARMDAAILVSFVIERDRSYLIAHPETALTSEQETRLGEITRRRASREPLQYVIGRQDFYRLTFEVTPDVLIPRPETEILVEHAIKFLSDQPSPRFCEIGTGSGCISISVLNELPAASAIACDISERALDVARRNAERNGVAERIQFKLSDVFDSLPAEQFDAVLSNPPYVPETDLATLQPEVRDHEPTVALTSGADGLNVIQRLIGDAPGFLKSGGLLLFEMGFNQSGRVGEFIDKTIWADIEFLPDLQGIPRILAAVKR